MKIFRRKKPTETMEVRLDDWDSLQNEIETLRQTVRKMDECKFNVTVDGLKYPPITGSYYTSYENAIVIWDYRDEKVALFIGGKISIIKENS